ncbi:4-nitrophenyl phosphatase [Brevibacillus aydinogluensis]|uniref:TIGR01457 family HAD-type hydrolase n=1 Tax=Brevibacillus aydinogluensis TaxID=927786 RepID=UPI0028938205|nr:TIGR01457 family HAD-type hydrolase [Brevibacillus aydinogluensis]MDT3415881.1 4-nitrophenyl phosphatase [Brevibacillus aydinogluensis]
MKQYKGYLLDLDGTIYRGREAIPGAARFVQHLRKQGIPYLYLTNNSSASPEQVAARLTGLGIDAEPEEVYTSAMATAHYLKEQAPAGTPVYVIGEEGLIAQLKASGFTISEERPRYVVVGIDRSFDYAKLTTAARAIRQGANLIATNADAALPTEQGLFPGNGSLVAAVSTASGVKPVVVGKPERIIVDYALTRLGTSAGETLIVGDNLDTDIAAGNCSGMDSLLVLTGYSTREDVETHPCRPTHIASDLADWLGRIGG